VVVAELVLLFVVVDAARLGGVRLLVLFLVFYYDMYVRCCATF